MENRRPRVHNRFKLPFLLGCFVCGVAMAVGGVLTGVSGFVVPGAFVALVSVAPIWVILTGRGNPRWMRSPLDPPPEGDAAEPSGAEGRGATPTRLGRATYGFILAGAAAFVVAGVVLIVVGIDQGRSRDVFVGAVSCVFFGGGAAMMVAVLRSSG